MLNHIEAISDPRMQAKCDHRLADILAITVCAVICGADDWNAIESFGKAKENWFSSFLELPNGIPSHDTFRRLFSLLSPSEFEEFFSTWAKQVAGQVRGVIAIDGKTLRRSHDNGAGKSAIHMVSAWSCENRMVLGQVKTEEKSNEITAIPRLLSLLSIKGCIITIDAMGCQKLIASQIVDSRGDYVLAVKGNQPTLHDAIKAQFEQADDANYEGYEMDYFETSEKSRNRFEVRRHWTLNVAQIDLNSEGWSKLKTIAMVESHREIAGESSMEYRYYICTIENNAEELGKAVRNHWGVENNLHWQLDMSFREDESRMRKGYSAENFAVMRHVTLNLLKKDKSVKLGIKNKRLKAGWDEQYLAKVLMDA